MNNVRRPVRKAKPANVTAEPVAYLAERTGGSSLVVDPLKTQFLRSIADVKANAVAAGAASGARYQRDDLFAIAEIGYHYLFSGGVRLAHLIFDALHALAPEEPYFALALGLASDRRGDKAAARAAYVRAAALAPADARPLVNLAELHLEAGELEPAKRELTRAVHKARASGDTALETKASAILAHLSSAPAPQREAPRRPTPRSPR